MLMSPWQTQDPAATGSRWPTAWRCRNPSSLCYREFPECLVVHWLLMMWFTVLVVCKFSTSLTLPRFLAPPPPPPPPPSDFFLHFLANMNDFFYVSAANRRIEKIFSCLFNLFFWSVLYSYKKLLSPFLPRSHFGIRFFFLLSQR